MQPEHTGEKSDGQRDLPGAELRDFEACAASQDGGERQARGLLFELIPSRAERVAPFAIDRHHAVHHRDEQRSEHDQCGEVAVYEQVRDAPEGQAAEARVRVTRVMP